MSSYHVAFDNDIKLPLRAHIDSHILYTIDTVLEGDILSGTKLMHQCTSELQPWVLNKKGLGVVQLVSWGLFK